MRRSVRGASVVSPGESGLRINRGETLFGSLGVIVLGFTGRMALAAGYLKGNRYQSRVEIGPLFELRPMASEQS